MRTKKEPKIPLDRAVIVEGLQDIKRLADTRGTMLSGSSLGKIAKVAEDLLFMHGEIVP
jgi:hypothetical protein